MPRPITWWRLYRGKVWHVGWAGDAAACGKEPAGSPEAVGERAPGGSMLVLDALSEVARGPTQWHRSLRHTGACIRWGLHRQEDLQTPHQRLKLAGQFDVMAGYDWSSALGCAGFRFWTGVPFYGLYVLAVGGGEPAPVEAG